MNRGFQRLVLPGGTSQWLCINAGVSQGSILGPLLFLLYINDIVNEINSNIRLIADNTSLYLIVDFPDSAAQILKVVHSTLFLNEVPIKEVIYHKHIDLFFSQRCDWHMHIEYVTEKAWARINLLRRYKFILDRKSL